MKNKNFKKLKVLSIGLCVGTTLLTGCNNKEHFGTSTISYESKIPQGKIKYDDLSNHLKIVTLEQNEMTNHLLLMKNIEEYNYDSIYRYDATTYVDLKTGTSIIKYTVNNDKKTWTIGENLNIIEEQDITGYLLQEDFIKKEYDVNEIITFFEESILPTLDRSDKVMIK